MVPLVLLLSATWGACGDEGSGAGNSEATTGGMGTGGTAISGATGGATTGGAAPSGGASTGGVSGAPTGGLALGGGAPTGGRDTPAVGGASGGQPPTGGATTGGSSTGGSAIGGSAIGGFTTGGMATGGMTTGGAPTGGFSTGGWATGGSSTGGWATGGASTGGTGATGGKPGAGGTSGGAEAGGTAGAPSGGEPAVGGAGGAAVELCPPGIVQTLTVALDGSGDHATVQGAIDSIPNGSTTPIRIEVRAGRYVEKLTIGGRQHLCLVGEDPATTVLTYGDSAADGIGTSDSASTVVSANDFSAANLTFENSSALGDGQAVALRADGQREQFYNCRFVSYQDTLYNRNGSQYFRDCYVQGNTDYIFGAGTAVFDDCTIHSISEGTAVTAPRTDAAVPYGFVFRGGVFTADSSVRTGHVHLGRPWGPYAAAAFLEVELGAHIAAVGYTTMSENTLALTRFSEYESTGPGANPGARAPESRQLTADEAATYTLPTILSGWTPSYAAAP